VKVGDLANDLEISVKDAMVLTGKPNQNTNLTESEVEQAVQAFERQKPDEVPTAEKPEALKAGGKEVVLFWSEVMNHTLIGKDPRTGEQILLRFKDFRLPAEVGSESYKTIMASGEPDIRIVQDGPFEDVGDAKAFRELLEEKVYTGQHREAGAVRGMGFLLALFKRSENDEVSRTLLKNGVAGVIELAVRKKSYKQLA